MADVPAVSFFHVESVVHGHHIYKDIWEPIIGERLLISPEEGNEHDRTAVSILKEGQIVGHVPREMARIVFYFLQREGTGGACVIAGRRKRGRGLEVPCVYEFFGPNQLITKLKCLLTQ